MSRGRILGGLLTVLGAGVFTYGVYVSHIASEGENRLSQAEQDASGRRRPIIGPVRRNVRANSAQAAQGRINAEGQKIAGFEVTANWLYGTGIVLFVVGITTLFFSCGCKRRD